MPNSTDELELQARYALLEQASGATSRLENILAALPNVVFESNAALHWNYLSPGWHELFGQSETDALQRPLLDYFAEDDRDRVRDLLMDVDKSGASSAREQVRLLQPEGNFIWVELQARGTGQQGDAHQFVGTLTNIHRQKLLEESVRTREQFIIAVADASRELLDRGGDEESESHIFARVMTAAEIRGCTIISLDSVDGQIAVTGANLLQNDDLGYNNIELSVEQARHALSRTRLLMDPARIRVTGHLGRRAQLQQDGSTCDVEVFSISVNAQCRKLLCLRTSTFWNLAMVNIMAGFCRTWSLILERSLALQTLATSEERLGLAIEASNEGVWDWDVRSGRVLFSVRWCEMLGYRHEDVAPVLESWRDKVHPDDLPWVMDIIQEHLDNKTDLFETVHRMRHADGSWRWILDRGKVVERDSAGQPTRAIGTHLDVTEKQLAEERLAERTAMLATANEQMDLMLMISPVGFLLFNAAGECTRMNPSFMALLGTHSLPAGLPYAQIEADLRSRLEVVGNNSPASDQGLIVKDPDTDKVIKLRLIERDSDESDVASLLAAIDITQEHSLSVAKSYFISAASHELRTPLASIVGFSDLMLKNPEQFDQDDRAEMLGAINRQARVLESVVSQLLDISRIETGSDKLVADLVRADLRESVEAAVNSFRAVEMKHQVVIEAAEDCPAVIVDPDNFSRVIHNLLSNACKYSDDHSTVTVRCGPGTERGFALLEVEDHGIGMTEEQLKRIFEPFYRADISRHVRGLGIGMHIVLELLKAMNIEIQVESEIERGTTVRLTIPVATAETRTIEDRISAFR